MKKASSNFQSKWTCIKPEDLDLDVHYAFSFNPEEQPMFEQFYKVKLNTLSKWSEYYINIFKSLKYCSITVNTEVSSKGRFHYHGYVLIKDIPRFIINDLAKLRHYGTYEIDFIKDKDVWFDYVNKQKFFMEQYCTDNDMIYQLT